jgi:glycosyltransferase involved in cell wall biosynthesis
MRDAPTCSVVVCTRHRADRLAACLDGIARIDGPSFEVIVVDNTTGEAAVRELALAAGARYVIEPNVGLSRARNVGARAARGSIVAFIDDDATPARDWLARHVTALADATLSATTGRVVPSSPETPPARAYLAAGAEDLGEEPFRVDRHTPSWFEMANFGGVGVGPNMAVRRSVFARGWGFREDLGPQNGLPGEEHYAFFSLIRDGHAIAYVADSVVHHDPPATMAGLERRKRQIAHGSAAYLVMLLVEEPGFRRATLRYAWGAVSGGRRSWRRTQSREPLVSRAQLARAVVSGPFAYLRWRMRRRQLTDHAGRPLP